MLNLDAVLFSSFLAVSRKKRIRAYAASQVLASTSDQLFCVYFRYLKPSLSCQELAVYSDFSPVCEGCWEDLTFSKVPKITAQIASF